MLEQIDAEVIPRRFRSSGRYLAINRYFVDDGGLTIIQPLDQQRQTGGLVVKIGRWDNADPPRLVAHKPEETGV